MLTFASMLIAVLDRAYFRVFSSHAYYQVNAYFRETTVLYRPFPCIIGEFSPVFFSHFLIRFTNKNFAQAKNAMKRRFESNGF